ncbi:MAG: helix-turn-helix transcriptional regulator [Parachlamydiaceae bacterium]|nr:helix-turn-helix transcriptional regulator [Parachlamydiaceae bacterium]
MDLGIILIQKHEDSVEFFGFTGNKKTSSLENIYLNHPQILKSFAIHFKKELGPILTGMENDADSLVSLKGEDFFCDQLICPEITSSTRLAYYRDLGMKCEAEKLGLLSARERQCLKLLIQDKSAKETGAILCLSSRTVESYFENIKNKLSCWNKQEILKLARDFEEVGLL